jgi:hypothetical protein
MKTAKEWMMMLRVLLCALAISYASAAAADDAPLKFNVTYGKSVDDSFTGRMYVMLSTGRQEPRFGPNWFRPQPFFAVDVKDLKPGDEVVFDDSALSFPAPLSTLPEMSYKVQAVMRRSLDSPDIGTGSGTAYSAAQEFTLDGATSGLIELTITHVVEERPFPDVNGVREFATRSELLSKFHGRDITMRAAVIRPKDRSEAGPALYHIPGFGGDHRFALQLQRMLDGWQLSDHVTHIVLDPRCYSGHHVFADSANNGPVGVALVTELIPHIEKELGLVAQPYARGLTGVSSGGWSSLWLQITYPDFFGGVWSIAPDPVDFNDFQRINLYAPGANMYIDHEGERRPLARQTMEGEDFVIIWYDDFARMEWVMGDGGQLGSFEWVFSPRDDDGTPKRLFDRTTGEVDHEVALAWKKYDIRAILEENWETLGPRLAGKIHVHMGDVDTFYLDGAARLLKASLAKLGSDAVVVIHPGKDHGTVVTQALFQRIDTELSAMFRAGAPAAKNVSQREVPVTAE